MRIEYDTARANGLVALICCFLLLPAGIAFAADDAGPPNPPGSAPVMIWPDLPYDEPARDGLDRFGGYTGIKGTETGFFHVEEIDGRWWMITPEGNAFFVLAICSAPEHADHRLRAWGFNTSRSRRPPADVTGEGMPYMVRCTLMRRAPALPLPTQAGFPPWLRFYDVFDPEWPEICDAYARQILEPLAGDPYFIGYFIENEPLLDGWYEGALLTDLDAPFRKAFVEVARDYYAQRPGELADDWSQYGVTDVDDLLGIQGVAPDVPELALAWEGAVAEKAFSTAAEAARRHAPQHLNLGVRLMNAPPPSPPILQAMAKYCDVISMNLYSMQPDRLLTPMFTIFPYVQSITQKPVLISEFSYRGDDTPLPNTIGAPPSVPTQLDRGIGYMSYIAAVASMPYFVGATWFTYEDDAREGAWDRYDEDCNFGVVDRHDRPYAALTEAMRLTNSAIYELAADPVRSEECPLFYRTELMRWDRDWDARFLQRYARTEEPIPDPLAAMLPSDRRFHDSYWIRHTGPKVSINTEDFVGHCDAHMVWREDDFQQLALFGIQNFTSFPRNLWLGPECDDPDEPLLMESNARILVRRLDNAGRVERMTMVDGSFVRLDFSDFVFRADRKVAYLDLRFDHENQTVRILTRSPINQLGIQGIHGWQAEWEGIAIEPIVFPAPPDMTVFAPPEH